MVIVKIAPKLQATTRGGFSDSQQVSENRMSSKLASRCKASCWDIHDVASYYQLIKNDLSGSQGHEKWEVNGITLKFPDCHWGSYDLASYYQKTRISPSSLNTRFSPWTWVSYHSPILGLHYTNQPYHSSSWLRPFIAADSSIWMKT